MSTKPGGFYFHVSSREGTYTILYSFSVFFNHPWPSNSGVRTASPVDSLWEVYHERRPSDVAVRRRWLLANG